MTHNRNPWRPPGRILALVAMAWALALGLVGCGMGPAPVGSRPWGGGQASGTGPGHRRQLLGMSPDDEMRVGEQAYQKVLREVGDRIVPPSSDAAQRVQQIFQRIIRASKIRSLRKEINLDDLSDRWKWEINLVEDRQVNAFCLPAGKMIVYTGILHVAENDDQLATVIGHETAHALAHHASERVAAERQRSGMGILASLKHNREQESEADHIGVFLMTFAGYNPQQAVVFWVRMQQASRGGQLPAILSDHPSDEQRIRDMQRWVPYARAGKQAYDQGRIAPDAR
jgi:predicted Zn-dependent protease